MPCSAIGFYDVIADIVIPIIVGVLGCLVTIYGIKMTFQHEKKVQERKTIDDAKPWTFTLDAAESVNHKEKNRIILKGSAPASNSARIVFIIKNTDNGVGIIQRFQTESTTYLPAIGRVLDKNSCTEVCIMLNEGECLKNMYLIISDVYGTEYKYRAVPTENSTLVYHLEEDVSTH